MAAPDQDQLQQAILDSLPPDHAFIGNQSLLLEVVRTLGTVPDDAAFKAYRTRYREGIPKRSAAEEEADARKLYGVLAEIGGQELVGPGKELDPGTYFKASPGL